MTQSILPSLAWALALCAALLSGCAKNSPASGDSKKAGEKEAPPVPVEVAVVERGRIETTIQSSVHLEAEEEVKVYARTSNRVTELLVEEGDVVEKDQILLRLDDDTQTTQFAKAETRLEKARQEFQRQEALFAQNLVSEQAFKDTQFELKQLELALEDARRDLEYTEVRAPIAGTVTKRLVKYGDLVTNNQHLFDLVDFDSIVARVYFPEKHLSELALDQVARVTPTALGEESFLGHVKRIAPIVESKTGTVKVTVGFKEVGRLRPGMYVDVAVVTATRTNAVLLSKRSLVYDGDRYFAYRLGPDRKVERLLVEPKLEDRFHVEPLSGFKEGDQVVIAGQTGLKDGARVRLPGDPEPKEEKKDGKNPGLAAAK